MTPSLNIVSIKKWQNQTNDYNTPKQDMHYEKIPADFILFPPCGLVVQSDVKYKTFYFFWSLKKSSSSHFHRFFREYFLYPLSLSFVDSCEWILPVESNVFSNSALHEKDKV